MSDSESDIEEIKLSDIKEKYEKEQEKYVINILLKTDLFY